MIRITNLSVLALLVAGSATALGGDAYEKAVPADVWGIVTCDDVQQTIADFKASDIGRCLMDPALAAAREDLEKLFAEMREKVTQDAGADPFELLAKVEGAAAIVVFDCAAGDPDFFKSRHSVPRLGLLLGGGDHAADLAAQFGDLLKKEIESGKVTQETRESDGVTVTVLTSKATSETDTSDELSYAVVGSTFVVALQPQKDGDRDEIDQLIKGLSGKLDEPLFKKGDFEASLAASPGASGIRAYFDLGGIVRQALDAGKADPEADIARKLGVDKLGRVSARGKMDAKSDDWSGEIRIEGETAIGTILEKMFPAGPMTLLARLSSDVFSGGAFHLDLGGGLTALLDVMQKIDPDQAKQIEMGLDMVSTEKFNLRRDLLEPLGDEISVAMSKVKDETEALPGTEDDPQSVAVIVKIDDGKAIETTLDTLIQENGLAAVRDRSEFEGKIVWTVPTPFGLKVHYTLQPDLLVISPSSEMLKDVLRRGGESKLPTLLSEPSFATTLAALGQGPFSSVFGGDAAESLASTIKGVGTMLMATGHTEQGAHLSSIEKEQIAAYTSGRTVTVARIGAEGVFARSLHRSEKK